MNNSPQNITFIKDIALDAYGSSYDNTFLIFKSSQNLYHLIYSTLKKSIISYNLTNPEKFQIISEIKNAHKDYIDNFRYSFDSKNKRDLVLSLSSGDNNIKIWNLKNWECIFDINDIYKFGSILSACFLLDANFDYNYIVASNFFMYNINAVDIYGNNEKNKIIENNISTNLFIDIYYDIKKSKYYIITGNNWNVISYDFKEGSLYHTYESINSTNHKSVSIYPDNKNNIVKIFFQSREGFILIFNFHSGELINKIICTNNNLIGICLWDENYIFTGGKNKILYLIDINKGKIMKVYSGHKHWICSLKKIQLEKFGEVLITHGLDNKIKLWGIKL